LGNGGLIDLLVLLNDQQHTELYGRQILSDVGLPEAGMHLVGTSNEIPGAGFQCWKTVGS
jgi:hypothetical protein